MGLKKGEEFISEVEIKPKTELEQVTKSCFIVFSSKEEHIENVIDSVEMVIQDKYDFTIKRLDKYIGSDESQYEAILDLLKECSFGIVILDGLRPNVMFEYGLLKGLGKPVMVLKEKNALVDVRNFYIDKSATDRGRIENPRIDYDKHLSDIKDRNYKEYDKNNLKEFRQIVDEDFVKHRVDIINEIRRMMTPKELTSQEELMSEQLNVIAHKLTKTAKELIAQDEVEVDQTVKIIDKLAKEFSVEMPPEYYLRLGNIYARLQKYKKAIVYYDVLLERDPKDFMALSSKGHALYHLDKFGEALACIDNALKLDQKDASTWSIRAHALFELDKLGDALKSHDKALELDPKEWIFWYNKGVTLSFADMNEEAIECYNKALEINPEFKSAFINKCLALDKIGSTDEELECVDKALEIFQEDAELWDFKAGILYYMRNYKGALVCISKALEIEPDNHRFLGNKAVTLNKLGRTDDALKCIDKALKLNPKDAFLWYQKGCLTEDPKEGIQCYDKAIEFDPNLAEAFCDKGSKLSNIGEYDEAMKIFDEVDKKCEESDNCVIIFLKRGITLSNMGRDKEAIKHFDRALKLDYKNTDAYEMRGSAYYNLNQYERAIADYNKAIELNPDDANAYFSLGLCYREKGDLERAIANYNRAIGLNPNDANLYANRGYAYYKKGDFEGSLRDLNRAIELNPNDVELYDNRGTTYRKLNKSDKEEENYKKALELDPNHVGTMLNFSELYIITKNYVSALEMAEKSKNMAKEGEDIIISHFLMVCSLLFQNKKVEAKNQVKRLIEYLETIKVWEIEWDFSEIKEATESGELDENAKSLMLTLIELLENKVTLDEFKSSYAAML